MFMQDFTRHADLSATAVLPASTWLAPVITGLAAGTLLETHKGWQAVESLRVGDAVQTLDGGLARILGLDRRHLQASAQTSLIKIDGGTYDTCSDALLLPGQHVLLDTLDITPNECTPFTMISAAALLASPGAHRLISADEIEVITPLFADEEVVYAHSGLLLHCPGVADGAGRYPENSFFPRLTAAQARHFVQQRALRFAA